MPNDEQPQNASLFRSVAGDASTADMTPAATPAPAAHFSARNETGTDGGASDARLAAVADNLEYTLTVGQALERFAAARRKSPSQRTIQRYCIEGRLAAQKIRTSFGAEWLINEHSLAALIDAEPVVSSDASDVSAPAPATPATPPQQIAATEPADSRDIGDAGDGTQHQVIEIEGERRTLAGVLIENARLLAQVEGRDLIISELKEDRSFLREELREARRTRDDVKNIAERMLDTLKTMAVGRLTMSSPPPPPVPAQASIIDPERTNG